VIEVRDIRKRPPQAERLVWCEWFRRHGVDPKDVPIPTRIERHCDTYRLVYETFSKDAHGKPYYDLSDLVRVRTFVQLEGPPLPFPFPEENT